MAALRKARVFIDGVAQPDKSFGELRIGDIYQIIEPDGSVFKKATFSVMEIPVQNQEGLWNVPSIILDNGEISNDEQSE